MTMNKNLNSLEEIKSQIANGGVWYLCEPSYSTKKFIKRKFPENHQEVLKQYYVLKKLIQDNDDIIIISIEDNNRASIDTYKATEIDLSYVCGDTIITYNPDNFFKSETVNTTDVNIEYVTAEEIKNYASKSDLPILKPKYLDDYEAEEKIVNELIKKAKEERQ